MDGVSTGGCGGAKDEGCPRVNNGRWAARVAVLASWRSGVRRPRRWKSRPDRTTVHLRKGSKAAETDAGYHRRGPCVRTPSVRSGMDERSPVWGGSRVSAAVRTKAGVVSSCPLRVVHPGTFRSRSRRVPHGGGTRDRLRPSTPCPGALPSSSAASTAPRRRVVAARGTTYL